MPLNFGKKIAQGLLGNLTEFDSQEATKQYGQFLLEGETIEKALKLVRDSLIITNLRIIFSDHQGLTGAKTRINSINLHTIYNVTVETAGSGIDDSEITISYIVTPILKAKNLEYAQTKFEFPKNFDVAALYRFFMQIAYTNVQQMNS